ncbi:uncharacterized protein B0H18DRAFT_996313 [Fomitopsis serialis]|uniref:uncharacterized protein n=1 Tax=Fomitopsis serialis TaxID=139415 RepID=UPI00200878D2|nr:uncharacterized protein B0H18DRAFT_996313 [Neoantrodia serialis]KAH9929797.1 hypothetical protein B0H18DRAFT_996313 [Neoantrodia serialis]
MALSSFKILYSYLSISLCGAALVYIRSILVMMQGCRDVARLGHLEDHVPSHMPSLASRLGEFEGRLSPVCFKCDKLVCDDNYSYNSAHFDAYGP